MKQMYSFLLHKGTKLPQGATYMREQLPFKSISLKEKEKEKGIKLLWKLNNFPRTTS